LLAVIHLEMRMDNRALVEPPTMKIHIVNADNPVTAGRAPGWYFLIFRPNRYEIKKIRGP
jgi:hypothetical protein